MTDQPTAGNIILVSSSLGIVAGICQHLFDIGDMVLVAFIATAVLCLAVGSTLADITKDRLLMEEKSRFGEDYE